MDIIKLSQGEIKITDNVFIDSSIKKNDTDVLFAYYTKPHGKKHILVNYKNPGEFFKMKKQYYYKTSNIKDYLKIYKNIIEKYPELDSIELKMWFINLELLQNKSYSVVSTFESLIKEFNIKKVSYKLICPYYITRIIYDYIDYTGITEDELIKFIEAILNEQCQIEYYLGNNYESFVEQIIQNKRMEFVEMLIKKNSSIFEKFMIKFKPKFGLKFITDLFEKKEYSRIQYIIYKDSLTQTQRIEFLPKMIQQIYSFNHQVTYDEYLELFEGKIEITKFPYKKWFQNSKNKIEMYKKIKPIMDISVMKDVITSMIQSTYSKDSLNELLKIFID